MPIGFKKLLLSDSLHTDSLESFLLRWYEQIITSIWGFMLLCMTEGCIYYMIGRAEDTKYLSKTYFVMFIVYSIFFIASSILIPEIKMVRIKRRLHKITRHQNVTLAQKDILKSIINSNISCKSFFDKHGFMQFVMTTLSTMTFLTAYFTCEFLIDIWIGGERPLILIMVFVAMFIFWMILSWRLDGFVFKMLRRNNRYTSVVPNIQSDRQITGKEIMVQMIQLILKDTLESRTSQAVAEDLLEDICQLLYITNEDKITKPTVGN